MVSISKIVLITLIKILYIILNLLGSIIKQSNSNAHKKFEEELDHYLSKRFANTYKILRSWY